MHACGVSLHPFLFELASVYDLHAYAFPEFSYKYGDIKCVVLLT